MSSRPISFLELPSSQPHSSVDQLAPLRRPLSPATRNYRPFSILNFESLDEGKVQLRPLRRPGIRPSSSFMNMGFSFRDKAKEEKKVSDSATAMASDKPSVQSTSPFNTSADQPSSFHGMLTLPRQKGLKKKRSLASLLSASPDTGVMAITPTSASHLGRSPLGSSLPVTAPSEDAKIKDTVSVEEETRPVRRSTGSKFIRKNNWMKRQNMKVHPYPLEAPYMQAYDPILLENDRFTNNLLRRINPVDSPSFHDYGRKIPLYILDLGCGSGHWLLDASNAWENSQITGFDLVDTLIPEIRKQDNIRFVRGNFLTYPLPFADKTFDFVRMANLTLSIPYEKWEFVFSEVQRVLTIDGRLELVDDQLFFPYGPTPMPAPTFTSVSAPEIPGKAGYGDSFFDDDDDDTLEDDDSMDTESTLISDENISISSHRKLKPISEIHDGNSELLAQPNPTETPNSPDTPTTADTSATARPSPWGLEAAASRDMETIFENMLNKKFGIHTRPSDFVVDLMKHVFGNGRKNKSYHLKLAPRDSYTTADSGGTYTDSNNSGNADVGNDKEEKDMTENIISPKVKTWFSVEKVKEETKRLKLERRLAKHEDLIPNNNRAGERAPTPDTHIPEGISAKAAGRLGITEDIPRGVSPTPEKNNAKNPAHSGINNDISLIPSRVSESEVHDKVLIIGPASQPGDNASQDPAPSLDIAITEVDARPRSSSNSGRKSEESDLSSAYDGRLSAKAANRLGISYSALSAAAASSARRPKSSSSSLSSSSTSSTTLQSPGLLLWPATYIPLSPSELEMHACKHIHTLIGCKPALAEYIETFLDEDGVRLTSDEEFDQSIWDYECFRRRRFHWPSEAGEWDLAPGDSWNETTTKSTTSSKSTSSRTPSSTIFEPTAPRNISDSPLGPYKCDKLTHVRTIRVYEAVKVNG